MSKPVQIPRTRHLRHDLDPINPGARNRRRKLQSWLDTQTSKFATTGETQTITAVDETDSVAATGTLTVTGNFSNNETVLVGDKNYTFKSNANFNATTSNEVLLGGSAADSLQNLYDAINRNGDTRGSSYSYNTTANGEVTATGIDATTITVTARVLGTDANSVPTTEAADNASWGGSTLSGGTDGNTLTDAAHGMANGDGPHLISSTMTLPAGLDGSTPYYIGVVDANTIQLFLNQDDAVKGPGFGAEVNFTDAGSGDITLDPEVSSQSIIEHMRDGALPTELQNSTDIDDFA